MEEEDKPTFGGVWKQRFSKGHFSLDRSDFNLQNLWREYDDNGRKVNETLRPYGPEEIMSGLETWLEEHATELKFEQFASDGLVSANQQDLEMWAEVIVELEWLNLSCYKGRYSLSENLVLIFLIEFFLVTVHNREAHRQILDRILVVVVRYVNGWKVDWATNLSNLAARFHGENRTQWQILLELFEALGYELELDS